jgi:hypothetical protein
MISTIKNLFVTGFAIAITNGCATYTIPIQSFSLQTEGIHHDGMKAVRIKTAIYGIHPSLSNQIEFITCEDNNHNQIQLKNSPSIETRFTKNNGNSTILFFDSIFRSDSLVIGLRSRLISDSWDTISINDIQIIEIQDGKKNYTYAM